MLRVALTGNIASGKSMVANSWRSRGALVIDADELARRAVAPGTRGLERIVSRWGPDLLLPSGELDRAALRDLVFRDADARKELEHIVHPAVQSLRGQELERARTDGARIVVSDIPLLFEAGLEGDFDVVVLVDAPEGVREDRLVHGRGLSRTEARRMIDAQWPVERKRHHADYIIENEGTVEDLEARAAEVWSLIEAGEGAEGDS